jgi:hypothetical protein
MGIYSIQTITALVDVVTGVSGFSTEKPIGVYRSGWILEQFLGAAGIELHIGSESREPSVRAVLVKANNDNPDAVVIHRMINRSLLYASTAIVRFQERQG